MSMIQNELYVSVSRVRSYGSSFGAFEPFYYFGNVTASLMVLSLNISRPCRDSGLSVVLTQR